MSILTKKWSIWTTGLVIALFMLLSLFILDSPLGLSNTYLVLLGYLEESIKEQQINQLDFNWQIAFLIGIFIGGLITAIFMGKWDFNFFPEERKSKGFIASIGITPVQGIIGGVLVMTGLQLAGDSFLGHWFGAMQLSVGSFIFILTTFAVAIIICVLFNKGGGE